MRGCPKTTQSNFQECSLHVSPYWLRHFFLVNQVEHQKLIQTTAELPFGCAFGVQLGLRQTQALISTNCITSSSSLLDDGEVIGSSNECLCLPKAGLSTKNSTKQLLCCQRQLYCRLVDFLVFNSIHWKKVSQPMRRNVQTSFPQFWLRSFWTAPYGSIFFTQGY